MLQQLKKFFNTSTNEDLLVVANRVLETAKFIKDKNALDQYQDGSVERSERHYLDCNSTLFYWAFAKNNLDFAIEHIPMGNYLKFLEKNKENETEVNLMIFITLRTCLTLMVLSDEKPLEENEVLVKYIKANFLLALEYYKYSTPVIEADLDKKIKSFHANFMQNMNSELDNQEVVGLISNWLIQMFSIRDNFHQFLQNDLSAILSILSFLQEAKLVDSEFDKHGSNLLDSIPEIYDITAVFGG